MQYHITHWFAALTGKYSTHASGRLVLLVLKLLMFFLICCNSKSQSADITCSFAWLVLCIWRGRVRWHVIDCTKLIINFWFKLKPHAIFRVRLYPGFWLSWPTLTVAQPKAGIQLVDQVGSSPFCMCSMVMCFCARARSSKVLPQMLQVWYDGFTAFPVLS